MSTNQTMVKMVTDRWFSLIEKCDSIFNAATDEQLLKQIAPGRNRGVYLLGHLVAVHDDMLVLLNFGDKLFPELNGPFLKSPDKATAETPSVTELRQCWSRQNELLNQKIKSLTPDEWFGRHTAVSAEDFIKEPHRNKLNILVTRTSHLAYHNGQLALIS